jgi:hypothetical protein
MPPSRSALPLPPLTSRRHFLRQSAVALATPFFARSLHAQAPSRVLRHASFGAFGMAWGDIQAITSNPFVKLVAVADVDLNRTAAVRERFPRRITCMRRSHWPRCSSGSMSIVKSR